MTLNLSGGSIFSAYSLTEQSLSDQQRGKNFESAFLSFNFDLEDSDFESMEKKAEEKIEAGEPEIDDILDQLPLDPFEMGIRGWLRGFDTGSESVSDCSSSMDDPEAELHWVWNSSLIYDKTSTPCDKAKASGFVKEFLSFSHVENRVFDGDGAEEVMPVDYSSQGGDAHDAISYSLRYLGVQDLLSVERVCRSLHRAVRNNLLWRNVSISWPLSQKITDDTLVKLTNRAEGNLDCLNLVQCSKITDAGLKRVLDINPKLTKLSLPGCVGISADSILSHLRATKSAGTLKLKLLRLRGVSGLTNDKFKELKSLLLGEDNQKQLIANKPRFYHGKQTNLTSDNDDHAIDVDLCPKCQSLRLVYDCPAKSCQEKHQPAQLCRACILCIARCSHCGRCIIDSEYMEAFFLELFCSDCKHHLLDYHETPGEKGVSSTFTFFIFG